jgi:alpha-L-fucosidase 2
MKLLNTLLLLFVLQLGLNAQNKQSPLSIWFDAPARQTDTIPYRKGKTIDLWSGSSNGWCEALPTGNGRLGAMVFGGVDRERIQLNENSLWGGFRSDADNPEASNALPKIRSLIFEGKNDEATTLAEKCLMGRPLEIESYQSAGDLYLTSLTRDENYSNYIRSLDIDSAIASVGYLIGDRQYTREIFSSYPDQVTVIHISCNKPSGISQRIALYRERDAQTSSYMANGEGFLVQSGQVSSFDSVKKINRGLKFETKIKIQQTGGQLIASGGNVVVKNAQTLILYISSATNYQGQDPGNFNNETLARLRNKTYSQIRSDHIANYQSLFNRVKINLGSLQNPEQPLNKLMENAQKGEIHPYLSELVFQYGRYLLISSSRKGGMSNTLQGIWNQHNKAPWNSDYHTNINLQMNYWPAEVTNLAECHYPLFDLIDSVAVYGAKSARNTYNANGWMMHHLTNPFWRIAPADGTQGIWPMGGAWLCRHLWEHYQYSNDKAFLKQRAYPLMKSSAQFFLDFLVEIPQGMPYAGKLTTNPSHSPENAFEKPDGTQSMFTYGATMDIEIITDLFRNCMEAARVLGSKNQPFDEAFSRKLQEVLDRLVPVQVSKRTGKIQEWIEDYKEIELGHRHISHLYGLFPGEQITTSGTPELAVAAQKTLEARLKGNPNAAIEEAGNKYPSFGSYLNNNGGGNWQRAWLSALWSRLGNAEMAYDSHAKQITQILAPNLTGDRMMQLDGSFGITAAMSEMLVQSHEGFIHLLPALPVQWNNGSVEGLRTRGGFVLGLSWENGEVKSVNLQSSAGNTCRLKLKNPNIKGVFSLKGKRIPSVTEKGILTFDTKSNNEYIIKY